MKRTIDENLFKNAPGLNHPANLEVARGLVDEFKIQKGIPRTERIEGETTYRKTWFGLSQTEDKSWSLHVTLDAKNFLKVWIYGFDYDMNHGDVFDEQKVLVHVSFDKLINS